MIAWSSMSRWPVAAQFDDDVVRLLQLRGPSERPHIHAMAKSRIDLPELTDTRCQEAGRALRDLIRSHGFVGRRVVSGLSQSDLILQSVRLPPMPDDEVANAVEWEIRDRLPYPVESAKIDHLPVGQVRESATVKQEVIALATSTATVDRRMAILRSAGLVPLAIDAEPCAILRALQWPDHDVDGARTAYFYVGTSSSLVILAEGRKVLFLKAIDGGGHIFDRAVSRHLKLPAHDAAKMRYLVNRAETLNADDEIHRSVIDAIRRPLEALAGEIELCLRYQQITFRGSGLEHAILAGPEASTWLADFFGERLRVECRVCQPIDKLGGSDFAKSLDNPGSWVPAIGLALRGIPQHDVTLHESVTS